MSRSASKAPSPVVFVHGLWLHASCWQPSIRHFRDAGYEAIAPRWPGEMPSVHATRSHPESIVDVGFDDLVGYYGGVIAEITTPAVLIGHAFGGRLVQRLVERGLGSGGIAVDSDEGDNSDYAHHSHSGSMSTGSDAGGGASQLEPDEFAAVYGRAITRDESDQLFTRWAIPTPRTAATQAAMSAAPPKPTATHGPFLLLLGGFGQEATEWGALTSNGTDVRRFRDRGRSLTIDSGWMEIADSCLAWLDAQEL